LIKKYPLIYELLNKQGRVDKIINKLKELEQKDNSQSDSNSLLVPFLIIGVVVVFLFSLAIIVKNYGKKKKKKRSL
jgi:hypothetical protein